MTALALPLRATDSLPLAYYLTQGYHAGHNGLDMVGRSEQPVFAVESGRVFASSWNGDGWAIGGGNCVIVDHKSGNGKRFRSVYAHLSRRVVGKGAIVLRGQLIGYVDSTGNSSGHHLHFAFGLHTGVPGNGGYSYLDPRTYFPAHRYANGSQAAGSRVSHVLSSEYVGMHGYTNLRALPSTSASIIATARSKTLVGFDGTVTGSSIGGSRTWDRILLKRVNGVLYNRIAYVHGSLGQWV